jgi:hypothetical protein
MSTPDPAPRPRRSRTPLWVIEGLDIARLRAVPLRVIAGVICVVGIVLAIVAPDLVPPTAVVGAAVAMAGLLLGLAAAVAVDAADLTVRGPRHVRAAGGELVAILPTQPAIDEAMPLAEAVLEAREGENKRLLLGLAAAGRDARRCSAWTDALAVALARTGASVLRVDLASGRSERPGLVEVVREGRKLPSVVTFEPDLRLARVGAGRDHAGALEVLPTLPARLPRDLDVLLVALPTAASRQVVAATRALDHVLVVAERDTTSRVDLIAGLDALEAAGIAAQVALLDDRTARLLSPPAPAEPVVAEDTDQNRTPDEPAATAAATDGPAGAGPGETRALGPSDEAEPAADVPNAAETRVPDEEVAAPTATPPSSALEATPDEAPVHPQAGSEDHGIRLLPGAEATPRSTASDLGQPSVAAARAPATDEAPTPRDQQPSASARPPAASEPSAATEPSAVQDPPAAQGSRDPEEPPATSGVQPQQASVSARDVDVMLEAAAAGAVARAETDDEPLPPVQQPAARRRAERQSPAERQHAEPQHAGRQHAEPDAPQEPVPWVTSAELPDPVDVTDELPRIEARARRSSRPNADEPERDDLRTTAQLAILLDDLEARRDRP